MGRLIDEDDVIHMISFMDLKGKSISEIKQAIRDDVETAYDINKVLDKLEEKARGNWGYPSVMEFDDVVEIVKGGGVL